MNDQERSTTPARAVRVPDTEPSPLVTATEVAARLAATPERRHAMMFMLVAEIAARLRGPCAYLSDESFAHLVLAITETHLRFEEIDARVLPQP